MLGLGAIQKFILNDNVKKRNYLIQAHHFFSIPVANTSEDP